MYARTIVTLYTTLFVRPSWSEMRDFNICHDDFNLNPQDGVIKEHTFPWLGFVQYIHVTTGLPHHSKAPRVVLVQRQFVLSTATDLLHLPKNYKLGNVVFGDYERDEEDCGLTREQIKMGGRCPKAYIEMPLNEITPHPEFSRFGVGNSLALVRLLRPMKSNYMIPICLPSAEERLRKRKHRVVYLIDYISTVPRDFDSEMMGKKTLKLYTHKDCKKHRMKARLGSEGVTHVLCSSGCGVRPGAPIISHSVDGRFELMGLNAGGAACARRAMRRRLNAEPPLYVDVYPYVTWIINIITAHNIPKPYPQSFQLVEGGSVMGAKRRVGSLKQREQKSGWKARTFVSGNLCFRSVKTQQRAAMFYTEKFEVNANPPAKLAVVIKVSAGYLCTIACARLMLPNRLSKPEVTGVGTYNITVKFATDWFPYAFFFSLGLSGRNTTRRDFNEWFPNKGYGNVVFGDYERDEEDCGLTREQIKMGGRCPKAYIEMPLNEITPHPEFSRFGVGNSLALVRLLRPMKSNYMIPICLPSAEERLRKRKHRVVYLIDYISTVPRDFDSEMMGKKTLKLYTHKDCKKHRMKARLGSEGVTHVLCSSGCGVRPGAPIISHSVDGRFELMGLNAGGAACARRAMRRRLNAEPPLYVDVYPYVTWIINIITAHNIPKPYPQSFQLVEGGSVMGAKRRVGSLKQREQKSGWKARTFVSGNLCFRSVKTQQRAAMFYTEKFEVNANPPAKLAVVIKVSAGYLCTIACARLMLPNRLSKPEVTGVGTYNITVKFATDWFPYAFFFSLGLSGRNTTRRDFNEWFPNKG